MLHQGHQFLVFCQGDIERTLWYTRKQYTETHGIIPGRIILTESLGDFPFNSKCRVHSGEAGNNDISVSGMTRIWINPMTSRTRGEVTGFV